MDGNGQITTRTRAEQKCSVEGYGKPIHAHRMCQMHYLRIKHHGTLDIGPENRGAILSRADVQEPKAAGIGGRGGVP